MAKLYLICDKEKSCHEKKHSQMLCCTVTVRWHGSLYQEVYHGTGRPQTLICTNTSVQTNHEDFYFEERHQNVWSNQLYWDKEKDQCLYFSFTQCDTLKAKYTATVFHRFVFTFEHHLKLFSLPRVIKNNVKKKCYAELVKVLSFCSQHVNIESPVTRRMCGGQHNRCCWWAEIQPCLKRFW